MFKRRPDGAALEPVSTLGAFRIDAMLGEGGMGYGHLLRLAATSGIR